MHCNHPNKKFVLFTGLLAMLTLSACGNQNVSIKGVDVSTAEIGGNTYVNMEAIIVMGKLRFPNVEVPVLDPTTMRTYGQLALQNLSDGTNRLYLSLDYEDVTRLDPLLGKTLPNGRELPSSLGAKNAGLVGIPVLQQSKAYLGGSLHQDLFVGAAVSIPAFDGALNRVPTPLNVFFNYPFSTSVLGVGGLFTSPERGKNGIAIFVKKTMGQIGVSALLVDNSEAAQSEPGSQQNDNELHKMNNVTLFRMSRLLEKRATLRVK